MQTRPKPSPHEDLLVQRIVERRASVAVVGQGYVGLTLAAEAAAAGFTVAGVDVDADRISALAEGRLAVPGVDPRVFEAGVGSGRLSFVLDGDAIEAAEIVAICVPTPVRDHSPDLSFVEDASREVARHLRPGTLVILESTTYPGTTDELVREILQTSGLDAERDFLLAYSPERIDPGNSEYGMRNTPKVVGGLTPAATRATVAFYEQLVDKVVPVSSCRAAELAKLLENTFRHVNIALVNEMASLCHEMGIDIWEVVDAAATKPFGFMPFHPGPGIGGHCIPLDPTYLAWQVRRDAGRRFGLLEQAQDTNDGMPAYVAARIGEALNEHGKAVKGAKILVLGVTYKPDVGDVRESPSLRVMQALHKRGGDVSFHDPFVEEVPMNGSTLRCTDLAAAVPQADCVVVLTAHGEYDLDWVADNARLVFDARGAIGGSRPNVVRL